MFPGTCRWKLTSPSCPFFKEELLYHLLRGYDSGIGVHCCSGTAPVKRLQLWASNHHQQHIWEQKLVLGALTQTQLCLWGFLHPFVVLISPFFGPTLQGEALEYVPPVEAINTSTAGRLIDLYCADLSTRLKQTKADNHRGWVCICNMSERSTSFLCNQVRCNLL